MPRLSDATRMRRRQHIVEAAMRRFARDGFANTSMADIIAEADSSAGSVYSHFASKAELIRFAASGALAGMVDDMSDGLPDEHAPASILAHLMRSNSDRSHAQILLQIWAEAPRDDELENVARQSLTELRSLVYEAVLPWCQDPARESTTPAETAADAITDAVITAVQGYLVRITIDRDVDPEELATRVLAPFELMS